MSSWRRGPLKHWLDSNDSGTWGEEPNGHHDALVVRSTDIRLDGSWDLADVAERSLPPLDLISKRLRVGDLVVVTSSGSPEHLGKTAIVGAQTAELKPCFSNFVQRLRPCRHADPHYMWYVLNSRAAASEMEAHGNTTTGLRNLNGRILGSVTFPGPPLQAQRAIADFLDTETGRIDALITKKERMNGLLNEWEQAAGLAALGDFRHGHTRTLRQYGAKVLTGPFGTVLSASEYVDGGVPLINPTHIRRGRLVPESSVSVTDAVAARIARHKLSAGDIVMGRKGDVGRCAIVPTDAEGWICGSDSIAIRPDRNRLQPAYLAAVLQLDIYRQQLQRSSTGAMVASVNEGTLLNVTLPALGLAEQDRAADMWARILAAAEAVATQLEHQLSLIREHRQALITAAVTGELDVPGVAA